MFFCGGTPCVARWAKGNSKVEGGPADGALNQPPPPVSPPPPATFAAASAALISPPHIGFSTSIASGGGAYTSGACGAYVSVGGGIHGGGGVQTLFLGNLPFDASENDVRVALAEAGLGGSTTVKMARPGRHGLAAFLKFSSVEEAQTCYNTLRKIPLMVSGTAASVDLAKSDSH